MIDALDIKIQDFSFYIPLDKPGISCVLGDSGVGKSYLFSNLKNLSDERKLKYPCYVINNIFTQVIPLLSKIECGLIVIDNFEELRYRYPELIDYLNSIYMPCSAQVQVILFARDVYGLKLNKDYMFDMVQRGNKIGVKRIIGKGEYFSNKY